LIKKGIGGEGEGNAIDPDYVHDLRVATRRLEEVAALLAVLMDKPTSRMVEASLKGMRRAAGELRDLDVTCEHLSAATGRGRWKMPAVLRNVARELIDEMQRRRGELERNCGNNSHPQALPAPWSCWRG